MARNFGVLALVFFASSFSVPVFALNVFDYQVTETSLKAQSAKDPCMSSDVLQQAMTESGINILSNSASTAPSQVWTCDSGELSHMPRKQIRTLCSQGKKVTCFSNGMKGLSADGSPNYSSLCISDPKVVQNGEGQQKMQFPRFSGVYIYSGSPRKEAGWWTMESNQCAVSEFRDIQTELPVSRKECIESWTNHLKGTGGCLPTRDTSEKAKRVTLVEDLAKCPRGFPDLDRYLIHGHNKSLFEGGTPAASGEVAPTVIPAQ